MAEELVIEMKLVGVDEVLNQLKTISKLVKAFPQNIKIFDTGTATQVGKVIASLNKIDISKVKGIKVADFNPAITQLTNLNDVLLKSNLLLTSMSILTGEIARNFRDFKVSAPFIKALNNFKSGASSNPVNPTPTPSQPSNGSPSRRNPFPLFIRNAFRGINLASGKGGFSAVGSALGFAARATTSFGPLLAGIAVAGAGLSALAYAAIKASQDIASFGAAARVSGTSYGKMGKAAGLGGAIGLSPEQMSGIAAQLAGELGTPGIGMAIGSKYGIEDIGGNNAFIGKFDRMATLLDAINKMLAVSDEEAVEMARGLKALEPFLQLRDMSPEMRSNAMDAMKEMYSPEMVRQAADFRGALFLAEVQLKKAFLWAGKFLMDIFKPLLDIIAWIGKQLNLDFADKIKDSLQSSEKATRENTNALMQHMDGMRNMFGGGDRGSGAIPAGARGEAFNQRLRYETVRFGALG